MSKSGRGRILFGLMGAMVSLSLSVIPADARGGGHGGGGHPGGGAHFGGGHPGGGGHPDFHGGGHVPRAAFAGHHGWHGGANYGYPGYYGPSYNNYGYRGCDNYGNCGAGPGIAATAVGIVGGLLSGIQGHDYD